MRTPHRTTSPREAADYMAETFPTPEAFTANPRAYRREVVSEWVRASVRVRRDARRARHREAESLAGGVGTDHPLIRLWVALWKDYENALQRRSSYLNAADLANRMASQALAAGDLDKAARLSAEARRLCEKWDTTGEEIAAMLSELEALAAHLPAASPGFIAALVALLAEREEVAATVTRRASCIRPKVRPPRTRSTFAHAPPVHFGTYKSGSPGRGVALIHSTTQESETG